MNPQCFFYVRPIITEPIRQETCYVKIDGSRTCCIRLDEFQYRPMPTSSNNGNNLIYDSDLDITWYNPSFTNVTWDQAMSWAENLVVGNAADWRLPTAINRDGTPLSSGYDRYQNELGYLYYKELGNAADNANLYPLNSGPFFNLQSINYWTSTEWASYKGDAWAFSFMSGQLGFADKIPDNTYIQYYSAMAVHSGDISVTTNPRTCYPSSSWLRTDWAFGIQEEIQEIISSIIPLLKGGSFGSDFFYAHFKRLISWSIPHTFRLVFTLTESFPFPIIFPSKSNFSPNQPLEILRSIGILPPGE